MPLIYRRVIGIYFYGFLQLEIFQLTTNGPKWEQSSTIHFNFWEAKMVPIHCLQTILNQRTRCPLLRTHIRPQTSNNNHQSTKSKKKLTIVNLITQITVIWMRRIFHWVAGGQAKLNYHSNSNTTTTTTKNINKLRRDLAVDKTCKQGLGLAGRPNPSRIRLFSNSQWWWITIDHYCQ